MNSFKCASRCVSAFPITSLKRPLSAACRRRRRRAGVHLRRPHLPSGEHFHFHLGRPLPPLPPRPVHGYGCVPVAESQLAIAGLRVSGWRRRREEKGGKEERATVRRAGAPLRRKRKGERKGKRKEKKKKQKKRRERKRWRRTASAGWDFEIRILYRDTGSSVSSVLARAQEPYFPRPPFASFAKEDMVGHFHVSRFTRTRAAAIRFDYAMLAAAPCCNISEFITNSELFLLASVGDSAPRCHPYETAMCHAAPRSS